MARKRSDETSRKFDGGNFPWSTTRRESSSCSTSTHEVLVPPPSTPRMRSLTVGNAFNRISPQIARDASRSGGLQSAERFQTAAWKTPLLDGYYRAMALDEKQAAKRIGQ